MLPLVIALAVKSTVAPEQAVLGLVIIKVGFVLIVIVPIAFITPHPPIKGML